MINGFRSKYSTLPKISDISNTDLMPYSDRYVNNPSQDQLERINNLETRLNITEKSNRALLEEIVRLHNDFRISTKHFDDAFKEERRLRSFIENNWKVGQDQIKELELRLRSNEDLLSQERYQIRDLVNQSKSVEELISTSKKDSFLVNDRQLSKLVNMEREIDRMNDDRTKIERIASHLVDEMKIIKSKLESQGFDFSIVTQELRNKSKKLEDDYLQNIDVVKKQLSKNENTLSNSLQKPLLEQKLMELKENVSQIRTWHDDEVNERRILEKTIMSKFTEISLAMNEQSRIREEAFRELQHLQRERDHKYETEKLTMQTKLAELTEHINSKVLEKDLKIRDEQLKRQSELEKLLRLEQETRICYEREIRADNERRLEFIRNYQSDELDNLKDSLKYDKIKYVESIKRLDEALSLLERQIDENKHEMTKIISAEVKARSNNEMVFKKRLTDLEDKIMASTSMIQHALTGFADKTLPNNDKIRKLTNDILDDYKAGLNRQIADLDARVLSVQMSTSTTQVDLEEKIKEAMFGINNKMNEKIESVAINQGLTEVAISQLKTQKQQLKQEIYELNELFSLAKSESNGRLGAEMTSRIETEENLRQEIEKLREMMPKDAVTKQEIEKVKATARKLAESMQTIKTVLGMKIQSEQNLRIEEIRNHQTELIQLKTLIEPLVHNLKNSGRTNDEANKIPDESEAVDSPKHPWDDEKDDKPNDDTKEDQSNDNKDKS